MEDADLDPGSDEANDFLAGSEAGLLTTLLVRVRLLVPRKKNERVEEPLACSQDGAASGLPVDVLPVGVIPGEVVPQTGAQSGHYRLQTELPGYD
eukprot:COSAG01_NODE_1319_length_10746_cov_23.542125_15_plen_95_part_00